MLKRLVAKLKADICQSKFERRVSYPVVLVREAITLMDEKGRGIPGGSRAMWEDDWTEVRKKLWEAQALLSEEGS